MPDLIAAGGAGHIDHRRADTLVCARNEIGASSRLYQAISAVERLMIEMDGLIPVEAVAAEQMEGWEPFDYNFQGPIKQVEQILEGKTRFHRCTVTVVRDSETDIDVSLIAADHVFPSGTLSEGQVIAGSMCILGQIADYQWPTAHEA